MLTAFIQRAQQGVDRAVDHAIAKVVVVVPFLGAAGFGTAAVYMWLARNLGAEHATLVLAAGFLLLGIISVFATRLFMAHAGAEPAAQDATETADVSAEGQTMSSSWSESDKELLIASLTTVAPMALPAMVRMLVKNLPLVAAVLAAIFVMTSDSAEQDDRASSLEPASV